MDKYFEIKTDCELYKAYLHMKKINRKLYLHLNRFVRNSVLKQKSFTRRKTDFGLFQLQMIERSLRE